MSSSSGAVNFSGLQHLLKSPSAKVADQIFHEIFKNRLGAVPRVIQESLVSALQLSEDEATQLILSVREIIAIALYENNPNLSSLFPDSFHDQLKKLILQIITSRLPQWREDAILHQCALPRLVDLQWRIDVKRASEALSNMSVPTVLVQLQVEEEGAQNKVHFELNKQTLDTMLDGLEKIKGQLGTLK